jgi:hypothetical protein
MLALKESNIVVKKNKKRRGDKPAEGENTSVYGLETQPLCLFLLLYRAYPMLLSRACLGQSSFFCCEHSK